MKRSPSRQASGRRGWSAPRRGRRSLDGGRGSPIRKFLGALGAVDRPRGRPSRRTALLGSRPTASPTERVAILECDGFAALLLSREEPLLIGRSMRCTFVLPATSVSRKHASVEWRGDGFHVHDLVSANGTFVNGKRINCWRLRIGDEIRIGGFRIRFRERRGSSKGDPCWRAACLVRESGASNGPGRVVFRGDLSQWSLQEIVPFIGLHRRDGILEVQGEGERRSIGTALEAEGRIYFSEGDVIEAKRGKAAGIEAFYSLFGLRRGRFVFQEGRPKIDRAIQVSTTALILEALRRIDERGGDM